MAKTLFEDQAQFLGKIITKLRSGVKRLIAQLPTGGGKTVIFSDLSNKFCKHYPNESVLIFVHREELQEQTRRCLYDDFGIAAIPIVAGMKYIPPAQVYVGMVESTFKRLYKLRKIGLVIVDECHVAIFNKVLDLFPDARIIGFTATPISANKKKPLNSLYHDIVCGPQISELISKNRLAQNVTYAPRDVVSRAELKISGDDYNEIQMGQTFSRAKYIHNTVIAYEKWGLGKKTIVFNCNTIHNKAVHDAFIAAGYKSAMLDSKNTPKDQRKKILEWYKNTPNAILCNVGVATTGFDEPTIECVIVNRATMSVSLWLQMTGRGGRYLLWKNMFTIVDMGANAITHGDWCWDRDWEDIFWNPPKPGKGGVPPFKNCVECEAIIFAGARVCPVCGAEQPRGVVPIEVEMHDFVMLTKNIDVKALVEIHKQKKQYYTLFLIGRILAQSALKSAQQITDEVAIFTLQTYIGVAKEWRKHAGKASFTDVDKKIAKKILFAELKRIYPNWQSKIYDNHHNQLV